MSGVAGLPRIVTLHDLNISQAKSDVADDVLVMDILAKTYRYNEKNKRGGK